MKFATSVLAACAVGLVAATVPAPASADGPTCSETLGIANHGEHIVADYVTGLGRGNVGWPLNGDVGEATGGDGAAVPGGPGPGFHFLNGVAPGASFCVDSASPGSHPGA